MSSTLLIKPEDVNTREKRARYTVTIAGCGHNSPLYSCLFASAGYEVICTDQDQTLLNLLSKGKIVFGAHEVEAMLKDHVKKGRIIAIGDFKTAISKGNIIIINAPVEIDQKKKPDYSNIEKASKLVGSSIRQNSLIIIASTVGVGVVEDLILETLKDTSGFKIGTDIGLAYCPIRFSPLQNLEKQPAEEQIVAACDKTSLNAAATFLETVFKSTLRRTLNVKTAELAILFEAAQREVNSALANEFAILCEKADADFLEVRKLETHSQDIFSSPANSDTSTENASYLLMEDAENLSAKLRTVAVARETNEEMARHVANLVGDALRNCGRTFRRAKVSILGISETPNKKSHPKSLVKKLAKMMEKRGAKVSVFDPYFPAESADAEPSAKKTLAETLEGANCMVLVTPHDQFKRLSLRSLKVMMKMPAAIVDLAGVFEPEKVEKEGLLYRGLGRGVWKK